ncbi:hypothetical protein LJK88_11440 [Paenibacillus sp. P26]|nr:hypothetical protein LJK88_11440 [Paenibacillus sp. P26]
MDYSVYQDSSSSPAIVQMISHCTYCTMISVDPEYRTPIACTKFSGSSRPVLVNLATCLGCGEYKNQTPSGAAADTAEQIDSRYIKKRF